MEVRVVMAHNQALDKQIEVLSSMQNEELSLPEKLEIAEQIRKLIETDRAIVAPKENRSQPQQVKCEAFQARGSTSNLQLSLAIIQVVLLSGIVVSLLL